MRKRRRDCRVPGRARISLQRISARNLATIETGKGNQDAGRFIVDALLATLTNVNVDKDRFRELIRQAIAIRDAIPASGTIEPDACTWAPKNDADILEKAKSVGILSTIDGDARSLRSTLLFGLKGISAYYPHAAVLGRTNDIKLLFLQKGLVSMLRDLTVPEMLSLVLECGKTGVVVLALLDSPNTTVEGNLARMVPVR